MNKVGMHHMKSKDMAWEITESLAAGLGVGFLKLKRKREHHPPAMPSKKFRELRATLARNDKQQEDQCRQIKTIKALSRYASVCLEQDFSARAANQDCSCQPSIKSSDPRDGSNRASVTLGLARQINN